VIRFSMSFVISIINSVQSFLVSQRTKKKKGGKKARPTKGAMRNKDHKRRVRQRRKRRTKMGSRKKIRGQEVDGSEERYLTGKKKVFKRGSGYRLGARVDKESAREWDNFEALNKGPGLAKDEKL